MIRLEARELNCGALTPLEAERAGNLLALAADGSPVDLCRDPFDDEVYLTRWHCEPPAPGVRFVVIREKWDADGYAVRTIEEIRPVQATNVPRPG